jgi:hypothetical protein
VFLLLRHDKARCQLDGALEKSANAMRSGKAPGGIMGDCDDAVARLLSAMPATPGDSKSRQVIGWIPYASTDVREYPDVGGWGGCIQKGNSWSDYIADVEEAAVPYHEALREAVMKSGLRRGGDWHQFSPDGVPVFDDGTIATFSFRGWGDLMAAIWADTDGRCHGYMDYYMDSCVENAGIELSPPRGSIEGWDDRLRYRED